MAVNDAQLSRLITALEKLVGTKKGTADTGESPLDEAASKAALGQAVSESSIADMGAQIKDQKDLLGILEKQLEVVELKEKRQQALGSHIQQQNAIEQNILQRRLDAKNKDLDFQQQLLAANVKELEDAYDKTGEAVEHNEELDKRIAMLKIQSRELAKHAKFNKDLHGTLDGIDSKISSITGLVMLKTDAYKNSVFGKIEKASGGDMRKMLSATGQSIAQVGVSLARAVHPAGLFSTAMASLTQNTIDLIKTQDELLANFTKSTGLTGEYHQMITTTNVENKEFHVLMEDGAKATTALLSNFRAFSTVAPDARKHLKNVVVQLDAIGVSGETSARLLNESTTALNMTTDDAIQMTMDLTAASSKLYGEQDRLQKEFQDSLSTLAVYGAGAKKVFLGVAAAAKVAGMSTSDLLGITEQFDTFQGAAEAVSGLNAILGGQYLNSLQMVGASEEERIRLLVGSMEAANMSFSSLSKYEQKAIAAKLGITDMAKANQLLGMSTAELDAQMSEVEGLKMSPERMKELAKASASFGAKWNSALERFTIAIGPLMGLVGGLLDAFIAFVDYFDESPWIVIVTGLAAAIGSMLLFAKATAWATAGMFAKVTGVGTLTKAIDKLTASTIASMAASATEAGVEGAGAAEDLVRTGTRSLESAATDKQAASRVAAALAIGTEAAAELSADTVRKQGILSRISERAQSWLGIGAKGASTAATGLETAAESRGIIVRGFSIIQRGLAIAAEYAMAAASYALSGAFSVLGLASASLGVKLMLATGILLALAAVILLPMFSPPLYIGLGILAGAMVALGIASKVGAPGISLSATAMMALAKGTAAAAASMVGLAASLGLVALALLGITITAITAAAGVALLAGATVLAGIGAALAGPGLLAFSAGILALDAALLAFSVTSIVTLPMLAAIAAGMLAAGTGAALMALSFTQQNDVLGSMIGRLTDLNAVLETFGMADLVEISTLSLMVSEFERLVEVVNKLNAFNMLTIGMTMKEIGSFTPDTSETMAHVRGVVEATAASSPEQSAGIAEMMRETARLAEAAAAAESGVFTQIGNMIGELIGLNAEKSADTTTAPAAGGSARTLNLYMDRDGRKAFAKGIIEELKPEIDRKLRITGGSQITG